MKNYLLAFAFGLLCLSTAAQYGHVDHWETAIFASENWKYHEGTTAPDPNWKSRTFNDSGWNSGRGGLGYGYNNLTTVVSQSANSLYLRKAFTIQDTSKLQAAVLSCDWDDGFVAYLNGLEIARVNVGTQWVEPAHTDFADFERKAELVKGGKYYDVHLRKNELKRSLVNGDNVLSIQIHNSSAISPDLAAFFNLHFGMTDAGNQFSPAPAWFEVPPIHADSSSLPIIRLTSGRLNDSVKIVADMEIIWNGRGKMNSFYQEGNNYNGKILLKHRGNSTLQFPKKSMRIETIDTSGNPLDLSLLGFPADNDWVLYAPYSDKSLIRNYFSYVLAGRLQEYAPRCQMVEVYHNGYYIGVYLFTEKIKRGKHRVDVNKLEAQDTNARAITGGYMMRLDWGADTATNAFYLHHTKPYKGFSNNTIQWYRPRADSLVQKQKDYSRDFMYDFENVLLSDTFNHRQNGYSKYINLHSFQDYLFMREISKEIDGYRLSVYFYKNHEEDDNKIHMGPVWDFNLGYGNVNFGNSGAEDTKGWMYDEHSGRVFWFVRLLDDPFFANELDCRWKHYRKNEFSNDSVERIVDKVVAEMGDAQYRNHYTWKTIGRYIWPNYYVGDTYEDEIDYLKNWISDRLSWMDINMPGDCGTSVNELDTGEKNSLRVFPNPTSKQFTLQADQSMQEVRILNSMGQQVWLESGNSREIQISTDGWKPGVYFVNVQYNSGEFSSAKVIKSY